MDDERKSERRVKIDEHEEDLVIIIEYQALTIRIETPQLEERTISIKHRRAPDATQLSSISSRDSSESSSSAKRKTSNKKKSLVVGNKSSISFLQEWCAYFNHSKPEYFDKSRSISEEKVMIEPFECQVQVADELFVGYGESKHRAKTQAAANALMKLSDEWKASQPEKSSEPIQPSASSSSSTTELRSDRFVFHKGSVPSPSQILNTYCSRHNLKLVSEEEEIREGDQIYHRVTGSLENQFQVTALDHVIRGMGIDRKKADAKHLCALSMLEQLYPQTLTYHDLQQSYKTAHSAPEIQSASQGKPSFLAFLRNKMQELVIEEGMDRLAL